MTLPTISDDELIRLARAEAAQAAKTSRWLTDLQYGKNYESVKAENTLVWRLADRLEAHSAPRVTRVRCKALSASPEPGDCDWPFCGCDPAADSVLEAIQECGLCIVPEIPTAKMIAAAGGESINLERADDPSYRPAEIWLEMIEAAK